METTERTQLNRRRLGWGLIAAAGLTPTALPARQDPPLIDWLEGQPQQSGYLVGHAQPDTALFLNDKPVHVTGTHGWFVIGFDRDADLTQALRADRGTRTQTV
ncbi:MAG: hypothetical protein ACK41P_03835, partial [Asticcacaulis sp.]